MSLVLAAVGALVAALLELTLVPYVEIYGAYPHPVLIFAVIWTTVAGLEGGLVIALNRVMNPGYISCTRFTWVC